MLDNESVMMCSIVNGGVLNDTGDLCDLCDANDCSDDGLSVSCCNNEEGDGCFFPLDIFRGVGIPVHLTSLWAEFVGVNVSNSSHKSCDITLIIF